MKTLLTGGMVFTQYGFKKWDVAIDGDRVIDIFQSDSQNNKYSFKKVIHCDNFFIVPGFIDVHVHLREPGFGYKETIKTGSMAAAKGGFTTICTMPNTMPPPTNRQNLQKQLDIINKEAQVKIIPYGAITNNQSGLGELSQMSELAGDVVGFSDDGKGVQYVADMKLAMRSAKALGKIIAAHCEDEFFDTYNPKSEWKQVARDIELVRETGCPYHICHVSTKETVGLVRQAKLESLPISCETAPHYLCFNNKSIGNFGRYKMNPPIRKEADRQALIEGIVDGTIDMIATDHAPHSYEEKKGDFSSSLFGVVGLETCFPALYTRLVKENIISLDKLIRLLSVAPAEVFGIAGGEIAIGSIADITVLDLNTSKKVDTNTFLSKGKSTPFDGEFFYGETVYTFVNGNCVYTR